MTVKMTKEEVINKRVDGIAVDSPLWNYYKNTPLNELSSRDEKLIKKEIQNRSKSGSSGIRNLNEEKATMTFDALNPNASGEGAPAGGASDGNVVGDAICSFYDTLGPSFKGVHAAVIKAYDDINSRNSMTGASISEVGDAAVILANYSLLVLSVHAAWKSMRNNESYKAAFIKNDQSNGAAGAEVPIAESIDTYFLVEMSRAFSLLEEAGKLAVSKKIAKLNPKTELPVLKEKGAKLIGSLISQAKDKVSELLSDKEFNSFMSKNRPDILKLIQDFADSVGETKKSAKAKAPKGSKGASAEPVEPEVMA